MAACTLDKSSLLMWESSCLNSVKAAALKKCFNVCMHGMYINVREQCVPVGTSEFIRSVWYEIYWTGSIWHMLLGCSVHSQQSESYWQVELYLKRYFSPLLQRPFAITAHPLPLKSELIWHWLHWSPPPCLKEGCFWVLGTWRRCGLPSCVWEC